MLFAPNPTKPQRDWFEASVGFLCVTVAIGVALVALVVYAKHL